MAFGIYLHIPYCHAKCRYCDFYSVPGTRAVPQAYVEALVRRLDAHFLSGGARPDTLYFGGGTPSLLSPGQVSQLISAASPRPGAEITLEANPEHLSPALLEGFRKSGINRLSLGVQSADNDQLRLLGRLHTAEQARQCFRWAKEAGFDNISGDIMMALPGYSTGEFDRTLELIASGSATHISAYLLKIEPGSAFGRRPPADLPDDDRAADFYLYGVSQLERAGYLQYEISNFARPGCEGRHNLIYWDCGDYFGLGPAAHSCMDGKRFYWKNDIPAFLRDSAQPVADGLCDAEDYIMLQLRLKRGLDLSRLEALYGVRLSPAQQRFLDRCVQAGYAQRNGSRIILTPAGMIIQNTILVQLLG